MRTIEEFNRVIELNNQGENAINISKITGIPRRTIFEWIKRKSFYYKRIYNTKWEKERFVEAVKNKHSIAGVLSHIGLKPSGANYTTVKNKVKEFNLDTSHWTGQGHLKGKKHNYSYKKPLKDMLTKDSQHHTLTIKRRIIKENALPYLCSLCSNPGTWMGKPISLHLDHINGDSTNHTINNLRFLCPNCHSQTDTYCGKNIGKKID